MAKQQSTQRAAEVPATNQPSVLEIALPIYASWVTPNGQTTPEHLAAKAFDAAEALLAEHRRRTD